MIKAAATRSLEALGHLWRRLPLAIRRQVLFATNHHFLVGVVGIIHNPEGRVLLLEHRFRTPHRWGLPGGFIRYGETMSQALTRELREEIDLQVEPENLIDTEVNQNGRYVSVALAARITGPAPNLAQIDHPEILSGGFFSTTDLPFSTYPYHRRLIERLGTPPSATDADGLTRFA